MPSPSPSPGRLHAAMRVWSTTSRWTDVRWHVSRRPRRRFRGPPRQIMCWCRWLRSLRPRFTARGGHCSSSRLRWTIEIPGQPVNQRRLPSSGRAPRNSRTSGRGPAPGVIAPHAPAIHTPRDGEVPHREPPRHNVVSRPPPRPRRAPQGTTPRSRTRRNRPARLRLPAPVTRHVPRRRPTPTRHQLPIRHQPSRAVHHPMTHHVRLWDGALQLGTRLPGNRRETPPGQASDPWPQPRSSLPLPPLGWAVSSPANRRLRSAPRAHRAMTES